MSGKLCDLLIFCNDHTTVQNILDVYSLQLKITVDNDLELKLVDRDGHATTIMVDLPTTSSLVQ